MDITKLIISTIYDQIDNQYDRYGYDQSNNSYDRYEFDQTNNQHDMFKQIIKTTESAGTLWAIEDIIFYDNNSCMGGKWFSENDQWNIDMH